MGRGNATNRLRKSSAPIAHRREDGVTHDLAEHLMSTGVLASRFAADWGADEAARFAGCWHDLGKYAKQFQSMIRGADRDAHLEGVAAPRQRVDHSTAGAIWAAQRFGQGYGRLIAYCIAGHHAGLGDWLGEGSARGVKDRLRNEEHLRVALASNPPRQILDLPDPTRPLPTGADLSLWTRMLASALFDADFLDSEGFFDEAKSSTRQIWPSLNVFGPKLDAKLAQIAASAPLNPVNRLRQDVLSACRKAAELPPGLFSLTVPTGGGKTLSSLAFAIGHAARHGLRRVIYAIPFTSIVEQTADVFRRALGDEAVLEHHSALGPRPERKSARSRLASENWDAPLIVTTTVQLLNRCSRAEHLKSGSYTTSRAAC